MPSKRMMEINSNVNDKTPVESLSLAISSRVPRQKKSKTRKRNKAKSQQLRVGEQSTQGHTHTHDALNFADDWSIEFCPCRMCTGSDKRVC